MAPPATTISRTAARNTLGCEAPFARRPDPDCDPRDGVAAVLRAGVFFPADPPGPLLAGPLAPPPDPPGPLALTTWVLPPRRPASSPIDPTVAHPTWRRPRCVDSPLPRGCHTSRGLRSETTPSGRLRSVPSARLPAPGASRPHRVVGCGPPASARASRGCADGLRRTSLRP